MGHSNVCSMTSFVRQDFSNERMSWYWEIRSVNSRYLELHVRLPDTMKSIESDIRAALKQRISRGKIEINLNLQKDSHSESLKINLEKVHAINEAANELQEVTGPGQTLPILEILQWPGVIIPQDKIDEDQLERIIRSLDSTLDKLIDYRRLEGKELHSILEEKLCEIEGLIIRLEQDLPDILTQHQEKLREKIQLIAPEFISDQAAHGQTISERAASERAEQEILILINKSDITEEVDRLKVHIAEVHRILNNDTVMGRRLDFMMQELNREANTLSSKSISSEITLLAVELKVLIEQMREQVQNIE